MGNYKSIRTSAKGRRGTRETWGQEIGDGLKEKKRKCT